MRPGARTPEELETLLEDAFVVRDEVALADLFEDGAVLVTANPSCQSRGPDAIASAAVELWGREATFVADAGRVVQARDTALVLARQGIGVVRRASDGTWRYAIALLVADYNPQEEA